MAPAFVCISWHPLLCATANARLCVHQPSMCRSLALFSHAAVALVAVVLARVANKPGGGKGGLLYAANC
eukprot:366370-Chlamydomonas_euryale.AAC.7